MTGRVQKFLEFRWCLFEVIKRDGWLAAKKQRQTGDGAAVINGPQPDDAIASRGERAAAEKMSHVSMPGRLGGASDNDILM